MSCSETTAKVLKNELTNSVTTHCGPNLPYKVNNLTHKRNRPNSLSFAVI